MVVGFQQSTYEFSEGDGTVAVLVDRLSEIAQSFSISVAGGKSKLLHLYNNTRDTVGSKLCMHWYIMNLYVYIASTL